MQKKYYKNFVLLLVIILLVPISFFFVACGSKHKPQINVFQDMVDYIKTNVTDTSVPDFYGYTFHYTANDSQAREKQFMITYNIKHDTLYFMGAYKDTTFIAQQKRLDNYSNNICQIYAQYQHTENNISSAYNGVIDLPATAYSNMLATIALPDFSKLSESITEDIKITFRQKLSNLLYEYFNELNNFYVEKVKNGDTSYNAAIYQYFYLPIIQVENK